GGLRGGTNVVDSLGASSPKSRKIRSIRNQARRFNVLSGPVHRRQARGHREGVDPNPVRVDEPFGAHVKRVRTALKSIEGRSDIFRAPDFEHRDIKAKCAGGGLDLHDFLYGESIADVAYYRQPAQAGNNLAQK